LVIRELIRSDFESLVDTYDSLFPEVEKDPSFGLTLSNEMTSISEEQEWFSKTLKDMETGNRVAMVTEVDSRAVGLCEVVRVKPRSPLDHRGDFGIFVRREFRGKGIGGELARRTLQKCKGRFEIVELTGLTSNEIARKLYRNLGFEPIGVRPRAVKRAGRYFDEELMQLIL